MLLHDPFLSIILKILILRLTVFKLIALFTATTATSKILVKGQKLFIYAQQGNELPQSKETVGFQAGALPATELAAVGK